MGKFLCLIGLHKWSFWLGSPTDLYRYCKRCGVTGGDFE